MAERPSLGRDDSYNRVTLSRDLKSQIYNMIADSSESLPLNTVDESDEEDSHNGLKEEKSAPAGVNGASSKLATESMNAGDFATPTPERPNPLEQVDTVRADSSQQHLKPPGSSSGTAKNALDDSTAISPMRTHEQEGPELGALGKRISKMVTHSDTNISGGKVKDTEVATASRQTTASQTPSGTPASRPGMDKRQSTMKRISSAFKRTVSKNQ